MSGITSAYPNVLYDPLMAGRQTQQENTLMRQTQELGAADIEMVARLGSSLINMSPEEAARVYPGRIAELQAQGYAKHAPAVYPGHDVTRQLVALGIPADKQFEYGAGRTAASGAASGLGLGGPGGGTTGAAGDGTPSGPVMGPRGLGSATRGEAEGGPPAPGSPGAAVAQRTHDFWKSKGFSEAQIAGIMAGGPGSESDFNPSVWGDNRSSYGLYQHHGPRFNQPRSDGFPNMVQFFGLAPGQLPTEQQQHEYAAWEISPQGPLARVGAALSQAKTAEEAATIWTRDFGVPADKTEIGRRARGAGRYAGLYGGATAPPGAPGVQVGGDAPAPPGGAPGAAAPAGPGGFAAAIPPPAVAAAPPPPAPGQRVSGNVGAILGGMRQAQSATPASAMPMVAGPGAGGPEAQPLRPAEPGWGTGTPGTYGYSGGSPTPGTVAPAPAPAPVPAAQPPAAPAQPAAPQVPLAPVLPLLSSGLTAQQEKAAREALNAPGITVARVNEITSHYQALAAQNRQYNATAEQQNFERQRQAAGDVRQTQQDVAAREEKARVAARQAQEDKRAEEKAAREAADAAQLQKSKSDEADAERVLFAIAPKVRRGEELTEAEADQYDVARRRYARGPLQQVPDGKGGTVTAFVGQEVPDRFPPLPGQKEYAGVKPVPGTEKQAAPPPQQVVGGILANADGQAKIMQALSELQKYPGGVGPVAGGQPSRMAQWTDPGGVGVRAAISRVEAHEFHSLAGSAQSAGEAGRLTPFVASAQDTKDAIETKLTQALELVRSTNLRAYRAYGPEVGGLRLPVIEEAILATIPRDAIDLMRANPDQEHKSAFDKKYGKGTAKMALDND